MRSEVVLAIVDEECRDGMDNLCYARIQYRILLEIGEKQMRPTVSEKYQKVFKAASDYEMKTVPYKVLVGAGEAGLSLDAIENLFKLYENCESLLQFMIDEYENIPPMITTKIDKESLMSVASYFGARKLAMREEFVLGGGTSVHWHDILSFTEIFNWVRITAAGEDVHKKITDEYEEALAFIREDPRFVGFISDNQ